MMIAKSFNGSSRFAGQRRYFTLAFVAFLFGLMSFETGAGTFYVDSATGNDRNFGATKALAWKSVPGMTGAMSWGAVSEANKVAPGTTIEIKAGAQFVGKRWVIDKTYYVSGTAAAPTTIRVSADWGSGNVVIDGRGAVVPKWNGGLQITDMSYIILTGASAVRRLEIKNFSAHTNILHYNTGSDGGRNTGNQLKWFDCHHSSNYCISNSWQDNLLYQDGLVHHNGSIEGNGVPKSGTGITMGDVADATGNNNVVRRVISYENGSGANINDGSVSFGFQVTGGTNTLFESCEAYRNGRDGFDGGRADNAGNASMTFLNSTSHDNKEDGFGLNSGPKGNVVAIHINTIAANNGQANWTVYDGAHIEIYHAAGRATAFNIFSFISFPNWPAPTIKIRNSYMSATFGGRQIQYYNQNKAGYPMFDSDYNLWVPSASNTEMFDNDKQENYASPPVWRGENDKFGIAHKEAVIDLTAMNFPPLQSGVVLKGFGIYLSSPAGVNIDRNGVMRENPPPIGPIAGVKPANKTLTAPTNLQVR